MTAVVDSNDFGLLRDAVGPLSPSRGAKQQPDGSFMVLCPGHDDKRPSLQVSVAPPGHRYRLRWHCHADCPVPRIREVAKTLGVSDEAFAPRKRSNGSNGNGSNGNGRRIDRTHPYHDEAGTELYETVRYSPKGFTQRHSDGNGGWIWNMQGVRRVLYRLPEVREAITAGRWVVLVEGEKDADRLTGEGFCATTSPMGALKWQDEYASMLAGAKVAILSDNDDPGRAHAAKAARSLHGVASSVRAITLSGLPEKGDVFDWLEQGHDAAELKERIESAAEWEPTAASAPAPNGHEGTGRLALAKIDPSTFEAVEWLERGMIPAAALTLLAGIGGKGKSTLAAGYAAKATRGKLKGKYAGEPINVLWIGNEDGLYDVLGPRLQAAGADFDRIRFVTLDSENIADELNIVTDIAALTDCIKSFDAKLVVIEPVVEYLPAATDSHNDMSVRQALRPLRNSAKDLEVAIIGLVHLNKGDTLDVATRITGSGAFRNTARSVIVVAEYPDDEDGEQAGWRVVFQNKSNSGPEGGRGRLYRVEGVEVIDGEGRPVLDSQGERATTGKIVWGAEVDLDPYNLPSRPRDRGSPQTDRARAMLRSFLRAGPRLRSDVEDRAKRDGIGWRTMEAAKAEEDVEDRQFPVEGVRGPGPSWWKLPDSEWSATSCVSADCGPLEEPQTLMAQGVSASPNEWSASTAETVNEVAGHSDFGLVVQEACARCGEYATYQVGGEPRCGAHSDPLDSYETPASRRRFTR